jgi:DNA-binding LytR/AlgR family response regulator
MFEMDKIRCIVIDDEELARELITTYIVQVEDLELVAELKSPVEAVSILNKEKVDLIFLDIQMPNLTGIEFLETISSPPGIIFTTAYREYAIESYSYNAIDYLLKPIAFPRFLQAVNKGIEHVTNKRKLEMHSSSSAESVGSLDEESILVKSERKLLRLKLQEIELIEGMSEYVAYHLNGKRVLSLNSLKSLEKELPSNQFIRVHKSSIVNKKFVTGIEGNMLLVNGKKISVGASYKLKVMEDLFGQKD